MSPEIIVSEQKHDIPIIIKQCSVVICSTVANIKRRICQVDYKMSLYQDIGNEYAIKAFYELFIICFRQCSVIHESVQM